MGELVGTLVRYFVGTSFSAEMDEVVCSVVGVSVGADVGATFSDQGGFFDG